MVDALVLGTNVYGVGVRVPSRPVYFFEFISILKKISLNNRIFSAFLVKAVDIILFKYFLLPNNNFRFIILNI